MITAIVLTFIWGWKCADWWSGGNGILAAYLGGCFIGAICIYVLGLP